MREIVFRGMDVEGAWHYGNLNVLVSRHRGVKAGSYISNNSGAPFAYQVRPETVGQFTGLLDKNGTMIFEGDRLRYKSREKTGERRGFNVYEDIDLTGYVEWGGHNDGYGSSFIPAFMVKTAESITYGSSFYANKKSDPLTMIKANLTKPLTSGKFGYEIIGNIHEPEVQP